MNSIILLDAVLTRTRAGQQPVEIARTLAVPLCAVLEILRIDAEQQALLGRLRKWPESAGPGCATPGILKRVAKAGA